MRTRRIIKKSSPWLKKNAGIRKNCLRGSFPLNLLFSMNKPLISKTRLAPTPSGYLHVGNVMSFLITSAFAQKHGADVLLRIDDLDKSRVKDEYINDIFETLYFLDIPYQVGPRDTLDFKTNYSQQHRLPLYESALKDLADNGACFACVCSRKTLAAAGSSTAYPGFCKQLDIPLSEEGSCWRFRTNEEETVPLIIYPNHRISVPFPIAMKDFVIRKKDRYPAYQLSSVVDDIYFGVNLIVRGADLWHSTLAQLQLAGKMAEGLPFLNTVFHHHPLIMADRNKLSKSSGSTSIHYLRRNGANKMDIYYQISNFLGFPVPANNFKDFVAYYFMVTSQQ
jgi:glutamyl/glutaminyl-tRNA synthetase